MYIKTSTGHQVVKDRSVVLTHRQRTVLIMVDGHRSVEELLKATGAVGVTREDIASLAALGLIEDLAPEQTAREQQKAETAKEASVHHKQRTDQERFAEAYPIAVQLTGSLGLRGFRLNLAVEAATNYEQLLAVAPKIKDAVGADKFAALDRALNDR